MLTNLRGASPRPTWASYWWRTTTPEEVSAPAPWQIIVFLKWDQHSEGSHTAVCRFPDCCPCYLSDEADDEQDTL